MARHIAKNLVSAGVADRLEVQLAYAIGVVDPVSVRVDTFGTGAIPESRIEALIRDEFPLAPKGIIQYLDLLRPIYRATAVYGHFGRSESDFSWEDTRRAPELRAAAGLSGVSPLAVTA
jgi:S-adenosylmethionine synthetase